MWAREVPPSPALTSAPEQVFKVAGHYRICHTLVDDAVERHRVAATMLVAAQRALRTTLYRESCEFAEIGIALVGGAEACWEWKCDNRPSNCPTGPDLVLDLTRLLCQAYYLNGQNDKANEYGLLVAVLVTVYVFASL